MKSRDLISRRGVAVALGLLASCSWLHATASVTTEPQGFVSLVALGSSDTVLSAPLARPTWQVDLVAKVEGSTLTLVGASGWADNQLLRNGAAQHDTYYLAFNDGAKAGQYFTIVANRGATVTLDLAGDSLDDVQPGDEVRIVPYWTFGTLFPKGAGVVGTTSHGVRPTEILVYDHAAVGTNLSPTWTYYYFAGSNPGWRRVGGGLATVRDGDIIPHDAYLIYRQNTAVAQRVTVLGQVPSAAVATIVSTLQAGTAQDNYVAFGVPVPLTLAQLNLVTSGAFAGSSSHGVRRDELYVFDNTVAGFNKSAAATYYYFTGTKPGWRKVGGGLATVRDNDVVLQPGQGLLLRKAPTTVAESHAVSLTPLYQ